MLLAFPVWVGCLLLAGCSTARRPEVPPAATPPPPAASLDSGVVRHVLREARHWWLDLPRNQRFDASGLCLSRAGELLVVNDRGPQIYRVRTRETGTSASLELAAEFFPPRDPAMQRLITATRGRLDCEGLAFDPEGRLYLCEESRRLVLRCTPGTGVVEQLAIDWSPVARLFSRFNDNASFEGIAVGDGRLYLANERDQAAIIVVDLATLRVEGSYVVRPSHQGFGPLHYSDLSWHAGRLFVLLRHQRVILEVDPASRRVLGEYDFTGVEDQGDIRYHRLLPTGVMEGLAVDEDAFWLVSDNNGESRVAAPKDRRPVLLRIPRPR